MTDSLAIVRELAARGPSLIGIWGERRDDDSGWVGWHCTDCGALDARSALASDSAIYRPDYHRPGCLWRRAVEASGRVYVPPAMPVSSDDGLEIACS